MRLTIKELRQMIRESVAEDVFYDELKRFGKRFGFLPLTHETEISNVKEILSSGLYEGSFFTVGWLDNRSFLTTHGVIIHVRLPLQKIRPGLLFPDMRYVGENDNQTFENFLRENPAIEGGELSFAETTPTSWIDDVIDNESGRSLMFEVLGHDIGDYMAGPNGQRSPSGFSGTTNNAKPLGPEASDDYDDKKDPEEEDWPTR